MNLIRGEVLFPVAGFRSQIVIGIQHIRLEFLRQGQDGIHIIRQYVTALSMGICAVLIVVAVGGGTKDDPGIWKGCPQGSHRSAESAAVYPW